MPEHFDQAAAPATEYEQMPAVRIALEFGESGVAGKSYLPVAEDLDLDSG